jgi:hypothetical protein
MNPMLFHHFLDSPERHPHLISSRSPFSPTVTKKSPLTTHNFVIQYVSGNYASPYGVRQLAAAFLSYTELPIKHQRIRGSLWNQSFTNRKFINSFVLTFMQNAGGVGGILNFPTLEPFALSTFCIHPLCFDNLAHSLHSFALAQNSTRFFSIDSALFAKNTGGGVTLRHGCQKFRAGRTGVLFATLEASVTECRTFRQ